MRSLLLTAALAAISLSIPAAAFAASHDDHGQGRSVDGMSRDENHDRVLNQYQSGPNWSFNDSTWGFTNPNWAMAGPPLAFAPNHTTTSRLQTILGDLRSADARITADRKERLITPSEARSLRADDAKIHREATNLAARNGGALPEGRYEMLLRQVNGLDRTIARDVRHV